jgi:hypothetical protein
VFKAQAEIIAGGKRITLKTDTTWKTKKATAPTMVIGTYCVLGRNDR